ncbi:MAG: diguanylate cyclase [Thermodesulfobacteriota bacterium]
MERAEITKNKEGKDVRPPALIKGFNTSRWKEFQEGLSRLLGVSVSLNDEKGAFIVPPTFNAEVCAEMTSREELRALCGAVYNRAALRALSDGHTHIFKCHANMFAFAMPVFLKGRSFVLMGGRSYMKGREEEAFARGIEGLDEATQQRLKERVKSISTDSLFSLPDTFKRLAVPFLESLYNRPVPQPEELPSSSGMVPYSGEFKGLLEIYKSISTVIDKDSLYELILSKSSELIGAERASLLIFDNNSKSFRIKASKGLEKSVAESVRIKMGQGITGRTAEQGLPMVIKDIEQELPWRKSLRTYRTSSFISAPLKLYDRVIGVINLSDKSGEGVFSQQDLFALLSICDYATIALERGAYYSMSEKLKTVSMTDPLTGLFNRRFFKNRLFEEAERVRRQRDSFTVFIIDVDNFKAFNDNWGHLAGDHVLKRISLAIKDAVRTVDVVVRYGGEEFAVILSHTSKKDSEVIAERIRSDVEHLKFPAEIKGPSPTISIGIAEFPGDARNTDDLIYRADAAMYQAKRRGKNRVVLYEK